MKKMIRWYYGHASIRKKLVISYIFLITLPILFLGIYSYNIARKNLLQNISNTLQSNVTSINYTLQNSIQRENDNINYLAYNTEFRNCLENRNISTSNIAQTLNVYVEPTFWYFITSDDNLKSIEVYSDRVDRGIGNFLKSISECENEPWYAYHKDNFKIQWTYQDGKIFATRTILDTNTSAKPIGIIKVSIFPSKLMNCIFQSEYLGNGVIVTDATGNIISEKTLDNDKLQTKIRNDISEKRMEQYVETDSYLMYCGDEITNGWRTYYFIDKKQVSAQLYSILESTVLIISICIIIMIFLIGFISKIISKRVLQLKEYAEKVSEGSFDIHINTDYTDEIGVVAKSFHIMRCKLDDMVKQVYQMGLEKRAMELKALQAMINPHFLYNCLSSIKWKAIRAEQDEISDITGLLAKFYRTTLNEGKQITIVKNELENIKSYLELQLRTHENSFNIEYELDENGLECEMPNFLLQPVVENAIVHGVDVIETNERGYIKIQYCCEDDYLIFQIYNNGLDIEKENFKLEISNSNSGYGIYNILERIRIYYDDTCGVFGSVTDDGLVCVTVKIRKAIKHD